MSTRPNGKKKQAKNADSLALSTDIAAIHEQLDNAKTTLNIEVAGNVIHLTNLNKVMWSGTDDPITKKDYILYLVDMAPYLLPQIRNRPLTFIRYPNGVDGKHFFQRHWDVNLPEFVHTVTAFSEQTNEDRDYLICNNLSCLIWLGQLATLELHAVHCRVESDADVDAGISEKFSGSAANIEGSLLNYPDFIVIDLDPYLYSGKELKGAEPELHKEGFRKTCEIALSVKETLDQLKFKTYIKTSGKTGLHIYLPIVRKIDYDQVRAFAETIGRYMLQRHPEEITMTWAVAKRTGKVFFDHNMNARSKTLPAAYSARASKDATISTPLSWEELSKIYPTDFTIRSMAARLKKTGDLWGDILQNKNDLDLLLERKSGQRLAAGTRDKQVRHKRRHA